MLTSPKLVQRNSMEIHVSQDEPNLWSQRNRNQCVVLEMASRCWLCLHSETHHVPRGFSGYYKH